MKRKNPIDEARRYVENARKTLKENGELDTELNIYQDDKYVRAAGNYLWLGVLMASVLVCFLGYCRFMIRN